FSFAHRYRHDGDCAELTHVRVDFGGDSLMANFTASVPVSSTWTVETIALSDFAVALYPTSNGTSRLQCFAHFNAVLFGAQPSLADGQCGSGTLELDDIFI